jgi:hypothetical protein
MAPYVSMDVLVGGWGCERRAGEQASSGSLAVMVALPALAGWLTGDVGYGGGWEPKVAVARAWKQTGHSQSTSAFPRALPVAVSTGRPADRWGAGRLHAGQVPRLCLAEPARCVAGHRPIGAVGPGPCPFWALAFPFPIAVGPLVPQWSGFPQPRLGCTAIDGIVLSGGLFDLPACLACHGVRGRSRCFRRISSTRFSSVCPRCWHLFALCVVAQPAEAQGRTCI